MWVLTRHRSCRLCTGLFFLDLRPWMPQSQREIDDQVIHRELASSPPRSLHRGGAPTAMGSGSCCCMGCNGGDDDGGGDTAGVLDPKGFLLAMMIALVLFMLCHVRPPRRNSYVVYRYY
ncbi:hypothetical protein SORBI_3003G162700 [Sorghum bicolor]|uniref:Transmembrane protein n=1 Tax=Sorghum bicolor TaxID=4558 RepID=A0A1W0VXH1_SORBI|nr:hypothetical protein SORBI_3003G162700 [Sorghum bicolor]